MPHMQQISTVVARAAAAVAFVSPLALHAPGAQAARIGGKCPFAIPLRAAACARLLRTREPAPRSWRAARNGGTTVYASQPFAAAVSVSTFSSEGFAPEGTLALGTNAVPLGLAVDRAGALYVAISALGAPAVPSVDVFPPGATKPGTVLTASLTAPSDVAVDRFGTMYVVNLASIDGTGCDQMTGGGDVVEFAKGSTKPARVLTTVPGCPLGAGVDAAGSVYVSFIYYPSSGAAQSDVMKFARGSTHGTALGLQAPGGNDIYGVQIDAKGDVIVENVEDDSTLNQILTFPAGATKPSRGFQYGGEGWRAEYFALRGSQIFAPAYIAENLESAMAQFAYPSGREQHVQSTAVAPAAFLYGFAATN